MTGAGTVDVVAVGECLVDLISEQRRDSLAAGSTFVPYLGGQVSNLAVNVARLGCRSAVVAKVGLDGFGVMAREQLELLGVDVGHVVADGAAPTSAVVVGRTAGTPDFIVYRGADRMLRSSDVPDELLRRARWIHTSAFCLSMEPARSTALDAMRRARVAGRWVSLDPNYHPAVWGGQDPLDVLPAAFEHVDVTKPSLDDCQRIFGPGETPESYAKRFLDWGARTVVVTAGDETAVLARPDGFERFPVPEANVRDVTGAGDAFWSGLVVALLDGIDPTGAVQVALEVARIKVQQIGHLPRALDRHELYAGLGLDVAVEEAGGW